MKCDELSHFDRETIRKRILL